MVIASDDPRMKRVGFCKLLGENIEHYAQKYEINIGRKSKASNLDVVIGDTNISRQHACIAYNFEKGVWELKVLGKNGVTVKSTIYTPSSPPVTLQSGDLLQLGDRAFFFLLEKGARARQKDLKKPKAAGVSKPRQKAPSLKIIAPGNEKPAQAKQQTKAQPKAQQPLVQPAETPTAPPATQSAAQSAPQPAAQPSPQAVSHPVVPPATRTEVMPLVFPQNDSQPEAQAVQQPYSVQGAPAAMPTEISMGGEQQQQQRQHRVEPRLTVEPQREAQPYKPQIDAVPSSVQLTPASTGPPPDLQNSAAMIGLASRPTGFVIHSEAHNSHAGRPREPLPQKLGNLTPATAPSQAQGAGAPMSEHRMAPEAAEFPQWREQPRIILPHAKFGGPSIPTEPMGDAQSAFAAAGARAEHVQADKSAYSQALLGAAGTGVAGAAPGAASSAALASAALQQMNLQAVLRAHQQQQQQAQLQAMQRAGMGASQLQALPMGAASAAMPSVLQQLMTANNALNAEQGGSRQQPSMRHPANPYMQMNYSGGYQPSSNIYGMAPQLGQRASFPSSQRPAQNEQSASLQPSRSAEQSRSTPNQLYPDGYPTQLMQGLEQHQYLQHLQWELSDAQKRNNPGDHNTYHHK